MKTTISASKIMGSLLGGVGFIVSLVAAPAAHADERHGSDKAMLNLHIGKELRVDLKLGDRDDHWCDRDDYRRGDRDDYRWRDRDDHRWDRGRHEGWGRDDHRDHDDHHDRDDHRR